LKENSKYQVLTNSGFKDFKGIKKTTRTDNIKFYFSDGSDIIVTPEHRFLVCKNIFRRACNIKVDHKIKDLKVIGKEYNVECSNEFFDLIDVDGGNRYLTNGVTSHNCAFIPKNIWEGFKKSVIPTTSSGKHARIIYTSTPYGMNHFHKIVLDAKNGVSGFNYLFFPYYAHPDRKDPKWKEEKIKELGGDLVTWAQEYECSFSTSSRTLINGDVIIKQERKLPLREMDGIKIYEEPIEGHFYTAGVDTGKYSDEGDFSSIQILDITKRPFRQVASYRARELTYFDLVDPIYNICKLYNDALLFIENNSGDGQSTVDLLAMKHEYENIYVEKQPVYGFRTTTSTRKIGLQNLKKYTESGMLKICDNDTLEELQYFSLHNGKYQATDGYSDDAVMALVASMFFLQDKSYVDSEELYDSIIKKISSNEDDEDDIFAFGFVSDGSGSSFF